MTSHPLTFRHGNFLVFFLRQLSTFVSRKKQVDNGKLLRGCLLVTASDCAIVGFEFHDKFQISRCSWMRRKLQRMGPAWGLQIGRSPNCGISLFGKQAVASSHSKMSFMDGRPSPNRTSPPANNNL
mmetsp:Transcript_11191/g.22909  ORF Transcript_11191/g.22909 Transcript_11191/m.22909 type:complete len:126 (-) Transcript_11191:96-473(-)